MIFPGGTNRPSLLMYYVYAVTFVTVLGSSWIDLAGEVWENMALI